MRRERQGESLVAGRNLYMYILEKDVWKHRGGGKISEIIDETNSLEEVSSFFLYDYL